MTTPAQSETQTYEPTAVQIDRAAALRRFNRLYVYLPLGFFSLVALVLVGLMLWGALSPSVVGTREFASGLADLVIILTIMPLMLLCALVPAAALGLVAYRRQQPQRDYGRFQTLLWRLDSLVVKSQQAAEKAMPKVANPVIRGHAFISYWRTLFRQIKNIITRS